MVMHPWTNSLGIRRVSRSYSTPIPASTVLSSPSKEYIYAGGRLIATEEPGTVSNLAAPSSLVAAGASSSQININWSATSGADHYQVERSPNLNGSWTVLSTNVLTTSFLDTSVTSVNAYLYRVRAVDGSGALSAYSNLDVATAITFTDNPLQANSTLIRAQHVFELRLAVNAIRATANLPPAVWTDNVTSAAQLVGMRVKAVHIEELRSKLDEALNALSLPVSPYSDPVPPGLTGVAIKKNHIDELRQRVK